MTCSKNLSKSAGNIRANLVKHRIGISDFGNPDEKASGKAESAKLLNSGNNGSKNNNVGDIS